MNIISKLCGITTAVFVFLACQGPWDYWPENPAKYKGVWIYAHIVSERPVSDVCLEKLLSLNETYMPAFAFFESADITVNGTFNGKNESLKLEQNKAKPNCFDAPEEYRAEAGGTYKLNAIVTWDSSGRRVTSNFSAETSIPKKFSVKHAIAPLPAISGNPNDNTNSYKRYEKNDTVYYLPPAKSGPTKGNDLLSHYFIPEYSADVGGTLITMFYDSLNVAWGQNTIDLMFPQIAKDTGRKAEIGDHHRIDYISNQQVADINNAMDSMPIMNALFPIGNNIKFLFYATGKEYADYMETDIYSSGDSRIKPRYNIKGGAGIFVGMLVDTFTVNVKMSPGGIMFDNMAARAYYCGSKSWGEKEIKWETLRQCRLYLPEFCEVEYFTFSKVETACHPMAVALALSQGRDWDYHLYDHEFNPPKLRYQISAESFGQIRQDGERYYCVSNSYTNTEYCNCDSEKQAALTSRTRNPAMEALWTWCMDRDWQIEKYPQCGTAMISWARLENKKSNVLEREINKWCAAKPNDPQCAYR